MAVLAATLKLGTQTKGIGGSEHRETAAVTGCVFVINSLVEANSLDAVSDSCMQRAAAEKPSVRTAELSVHLGRLVSQRQFEGTPCSSKER